MIGMQDTSDIRASDRLSMSLFLTTVLHAIVILGITFSPIFDNEKTHDKEIVLSNDRYKQPQKNAHILSNVNLTSSAKENEENNSKDQISLKHFYQKENFRLPVSTFKIKEISTILNVPRETVRRKKDKLIKDKLIILDKKNKLYALNTDIIEQKILNIQIDNLSKFLSKFSLFFSKSKFLIKEVKREQIKKDVEDKFLLYLTNFLDFQIAYFSKMKTLMDIESIFILLLCTLNTTSQIKTKEEHMSSKDVFSKLHSLNKTFGLNATSISEITKVPRTTVLRKIESLEKSGMIKKDKFKRYATDNLNGVENAKKVISIMDHNTKLLGIFISKCLQTYSNKQ